MTDVYVTAYAASAELVVSRSRFIAYVEPISGEEDAAAALASLRKKHYDATHICYAYVADREGRVCKCSDDGEPAGTAGQPILEAVKGSGVRLVLVAVARYFGGIKLGVGGLGRAYAEAANRALSAATQRVFKRCEIARAEMDYGVYRKVSKTIAESLGKTLQTEYNNIVTVMLAAPAGTSLAARLTDLTAGRAKVQPLGEDYVEF